MNSESANWRGYQRYYPIILSVSKVIVAIIVADLVISILLSFVLSDAFYFKRYMKGTHYEEMITNQYNKSLYVQPHKAAGWINTPNFKEGDGIKWTTDSIGSRVSPNSLGAEVNLDNLNHENLVILLGSSVIDGYGLPFEQSPAGYLIGAGYKTLGFGISMYSIDQSYAFYKHVLSKYNPKVLVVGIHPDAKYISSMFVPFRDGGRFTPYLKPSYHFLDNTIIKYQPPFEYQRRNQINKLLSALAGRDIYYDHFQLYKRLSLLPFSDCFRRLFMKVDNNLYDVNAYENAVNLQVNFMQKLAKLAEKNGTHVIFVKFETLDEQKKSLPKKLLSAVYQDKNSLHTQLLRDKSFNILYISDMFKKTGRPISDFYVKNDPVHLTPIACKLLAIEIDHEIAKLGTVNKSH